MRARRCWLTGSMGSDLGLSAVPAEKRLILLPAVDVVDGKAVRLVQGQAGSETEYGSALDAAMTWQRDGAEWIHLVDLDAAFGRGSNRELLAEVVGKLDVAVELSGGIRDDESLTAALATEHVRVGYIEFDAIHKIGRWIPEALQQLQAFYVVAERLVVVRQGGRRAR